MAATATPSGHGRAGAFDQQQLLLYAAACGVDLGADFGQLDQAGVGAVIAQPQALPQHLAQRIAGRVFDMVAGHRLDLVARDPETIFQRIGGIEKGPQGALTPADALPPHHENRHGHGRQDQQEYIEGHGVTGWG